MSNALLAHVRISESARFDVEQAVLSGRPLTPAEGETLLALLHDAEAQIEEAKEDAAYAWSEKEDAEREAYRLRDKLDAATAQIQALEAQIEDMEADREAGEIAP